VAGRHDRPLDPVFMPFLHCAALFLSGVALPFGSRFYAFLHGHPLDPVFMHFCMAALWISFLCIFAWPPFGSRFMHFLHRPSLDSVFMHFYTATLWMSFLCIFYRSNSPIKNLKNTLGHMFKQQSACDKTKLNNDLVVWICG
jgi:hypothetical protein